MSPSLTDIFFAPLSPVLSLIAAALSLIVAECFPQKSLKNTKLVIAILGAAASLVFCFWLFKQGPMTVSLEGGQAWLVEFAKTYQLDNLALTLMTATAGFTLLALLFTAFQFQTGELRGEIFSLVLFISSGMMLLVTANSLLMVFMALELLSLPTYVLVGIQRRDRQSSEASLKYFLFGSFATVLLVFGIALLYAQFGTLNIPKLAAAIQAADLNNPHTQSLLYGGMALLIIAVGFKVGLVPFHMWVPDAYQGAPTAVTGFMGSAVKLAGFGLVLRVLWGLFLPLFPQWSTLLGILAIVTMFVGNIAALAQDNLKRMFAYSSISHAGYLMLGVATVNPAGPSATALTFYLVVYGLMFLGLFGILALLDRETKSTDIFHISGLGFTHPLLGVCFTIFALSAAGIPPTAGFFAKYFIFLDAVRSGKTLWVVLALVSSLIGVYYYLRVLVYMYMKEPKEGLNLRRAGILTNSAILICAASMVYFAVRPTLTW